MEDRASRRTIAVTLAVLVAVTALVVVTSMGRPDRTPAPAAGVEAAAVPPDVSAVDALASLTVLGDWDRARSRAWSDGDVGALRRLYVPGSVAGERDVAMLRSWLGRGLRVEGMAMQVLEVRLRSRTDRRFVLVVTDRLADPTAVDRHGRRWALPRDEVSTRRLEFRRTADRWLLASVTQPDRRPVRTTSSTSRSPNS